MFIVVRNIARKILPTFIREKVYVFIYRPPTIHFPKMHFLAKNFYFIYRNLLSVILTYSYIVSVKSPKDSVFQRIEKSIIKTFFYVSDYLYRLYYQRFERKMAFFSQQKILADGTGINLTIGSLGPGGAERQVVTTLLGLNKNQNKPLSLTCVSLKTETSQFFLPNLAGTDIHITELERVCPNDSAFLKQIAKELPIHSIDVLNYIVNLHDIRPRVAHFWLDEINIKGGMAAVVLGIPQIILGGRSLPPCNYKFHQPYFREGYRWLLKQPGVVLINNSVAGARAYEKWLKLPEGTIQVVHNGFEYESSLLSVHKENAASYRAKLNIPKSAFVMGGVLRFSEEKRPLLWLEIAARIRRELPLSHFLLVGNGPLYDQVLKRAEQEDLKGAVHIVGHEQMAFSAIAAMDIFLLTSRAEGLPNVLVEAQALGVPVVTTNVGGAPETLVHNETGWVLENADPQAAANIIVKLSQDNNWLKNASEKAPSFIQNTFSIQKMIDETLKLYNFGTL